jgi:AhpD family alkylhydroperoxidase
MVSTNVMLEEDQMIAGALRDQMVKTIKYVKPAAFDSATGLTAQIYQQLQEDFIPAPLVVLHAPIPDVMAGVWSLLRETLLAGDVVRSHKEAIAATVSKTNECHFCVDAHTVMLRATSDHDVADAILHGDYDGIQDPQLRAIVQWVLANRTTETTNAVLPPFSQPEIPEMIGTAIAFDYINRMVNIFLGDRLLPLPSVMKGITYRLYAATAGKRIVRGLPRGRSLTFLPQAHLPADLSWATGNPSVAGAFAGFVQAVESAGERILPESVRVLVGARVQAWKGETMGMSRRWVEDAVVDMEETHRAAARLTLLTALASYQVDSRIVEDFQWYYPDDEQLIAATAWASLTAARRAGLWLAAPFSMAV